MLDALTTHRVSENRKARQEANDPKPDPAPPAVPEKPSSTSSRKQYQVKGSAQQEAKKTYKPKTSIVSLDYLETCLQAMFRERTNTQIESRVRFKIQDLIDKFEKDWKHEIFFARRQETDSDGFQKKYVPKGSKLAQEANAVHNWSKSSTNSTKNGRNRKDSKVNSNFAEKAGKAAQSAQQSQKQDSGGKNVQVLDQAGTSKGKSMYQMLQSLAPDDNEESKQEESLSEDEDAIKLVERRTSMNIDNVIGLDLERYNIKATQ